MGARVLVVEHQDSCPAHLVGDWLEGAGCTLEVCRVARLAPRAWGVHAHPEVDGAILRRWAESDRDTHVSLGIDQERVLADVEDAAGALTAHWRPLVQRFAAIVGGAP